MSEQTLCKSMRLPTERATEMMSKAHLSWNTAASMAHQIDQHLAHSYSNTVAAISMRASVEPDAARAQVMRDVAEWINSNILSGD